MDNADVQCDTEASAITTSAPVVNPSRFTVNPIVVQPCLTNYYPAAPPYCYPQSTMSSSVGYIPSISHGPFINGYGSYGIPSNFGHNFSSPGYYNPNPHSQQNPSWIQPPPQIPGQSGTRLARHALNVSYASSVKTKTNLKDVGVLSSSEVSVQNTPTFMPSTSQRIITKNAPCVFFNRRGGCLSERSADFLCGFRHCCILCGADTHGAVFCKLR